MIFKNARRLARWAGRHPVITCQLVNLLAAGCAVLWLRSYAYHELPLFPYRPVCYDQERRDNMEDPFRELCGEITLEFASALAADALAYEWPPLMISDGKLFITGAENESEYLIAKYGSDVSELKDRWYSSQWAMQRVFAAREGRDFSDLHNRKDVENGVMHRKYGMPTTFAGLTHCAFMARVMIVGGDLNLPKKINIPREDADQ